VRSTIIEGLRPLGPVRAAGGRILGFLLCLKSAEFIGTRSGQCRRAPGGTLARSVFVDVNRPIGFEGPSDGMIVTDGWLRLLGPVVKRRGASPLVLSNMSGSGTKL